MALTTDEINAVARDYIQKGKVTDNFFKGNALLYRLLKKVKYFDGGTKIREVLMNARQNGGAYEGTGPYNTAHKEIHTAAFFNWRKYYTWVSITGDDELTCNGSAQVVDMIQSKIRNAASSLKDYQGDDMHSASAASGGALLSILGDLFNSTTSTKYGDIAEDDMSEWKANIKDMTGLDFTLTNLKAARRLAKVNEEVPDLYVTSDAIKDDFEDLLQPSKRYESDEMAKSGFDNVLFGRAPVVGDEKITTADMFGFNCKHLNFWVHKDRNYKWEPFRKLFDGDAKGAPLLFAGQWTTPSRRSHVHIDNIGS
jgi:hypothetical protein